MIAVGTDGIFRFDLTVDGCGGTTVTDPPFCLLESWPNPFSSQTWLSFVMRKPARVVLKIHNILGQEVAVLLDKEVSQGRVVLDWKPKDVASGVYFYTLTAGDYCETGKTLLIR
jgi:hypothetical protein